MNMFLKIERRFLSFAKFDQRLDTFMSQFLINKEYESLWEVCIIAFGLSHGKSAVERSFKANKKYVVENQSEDSFKSLCIINDRLTSKKIQARNITITRDMIKSVKAARERYKIYQNEKQKGKVKTDKDLKQKIITEETEEVCMKRHRLQSSIEELVKDVDELAITAQQTQSLKTLERSNDLRKAAKLKKVEINECDSVEESLILRRDSVL